MTKCKVCGGWGVEVRVVSSYDADLLGAPFSVFLDDSVQEERCSSCGTKLRTVIPDVEGLLHTVAMVRAIEPRKLTGGEIRFVRKAMGWKSKDVARHLELRAEHLSRCENGSRTLSPMSEKWFRLFVIAKMMDKTLKAKFDIEKLFDMKIESTWDLNEKLIFRLSYRKTEEEEHVAPVGQPDGKWQSELLAAAA